MPVSIQNDCPHCHAQKMGFTFVGEASLSPARSKDWLTLFKCNKCQGGLVVEYTKHVEYGISSPGAGNADPTTLGFAVVKSYPGKMPSVVPAFVPSPLDKYYLQAADALRSGHPDASGAMSRKVVDVSTQKMLGEDSKKYYTIKQRIDALAERNALTQDLKDWAHVVRLEGNDASHDEDPYTPEEADELLNFVDVYLAYVYTLPGRLKARRERAEAEKAEIPIVGILASP
jgi:hypothetical protein